MLKFAFDIQLFAVQTTELNTTGNDLSPEMKTYYDMRLLDYAQAELVHDQFGQKRDIPKGSGKKIEFRAFSPLAKAMVPLTEGVTPAGNKLDVTKIESEVSQYGDYIVQSDVLELTALDNTILEATKILGRQAGLTLDTVTRNVLQSGTNVMYAPKVSGGSETEVTSRAGLDASALLTVDLCEQITANLRAMNAPTINGDYIGIIHPYVAYDLMRDPDWRKPHEYVDSDNLYEGEIGKVGGIRFVQSTEAKIYRGDDLASDSRTLTLSANISGAVTSISFSGGTVAEDALIGRKIQINGVVATVTDNTASAITVASTNFGSGTSGTTKIYPGEGGAAGVSVFGCLFFGDGAYGVTEVSGGGLQTIVKQKGSAGTADPLDQRSSVGWKALKTAEILLPEYLIRLECCSRRYSATAAAN
jgi:N4-gp56 family major capsid protein